VIKAHNISVKHYNHRTYLLGIYLVNDRRASIPVIKRKKHVPAVNTLIPAEILSTQWNKRNEPDIIKYITASGDVCIISDDNLLSDISEFMEKKGFKDPLPYLHVEGKNGWEAYHAPSDSHILGFLITYINNYDVFTPEGELIREASNDRNRLNLCVEYV
jgi:hypothetical protein